VAGGFVLQVIELIGSGVLAEEASVRISGWRAGGAVGLPTGALGPGRFKGWRGGRRGLVK
jgi:hypothetical protein